MTARLRDLVRVVEGADVRGADANVHGVTCDSRAVEAGYLMVCVPGTKTDGRTFAGEAARRGAAALVLEESLPEISLPQVVVPDARLALALLADRFHEHPSGRLDLVGVTGTDGKTSIVHLAAAIGERAQWKPGLIGTLGVRIEGETKPIPNTTPGADVFHDALRRMADGGAKAAFVEVTSHALDMERTTGAEFRVVILSNFTRDHLDWHGTIERYREAKQRLFRRASWRVDPDRDTGKPSLALLPVGEAGDAFARASDLPVERIGFEPGADWRIVDPVFEPGRSVGKLVHRAVTLTLEVPLPGRFNLQNAASAAAACHALGASAAEIAEGIASVKPIDGRMERIDHGQPFTVLVDFAHTPDALRTMLAAVREFTRGRILLVFGAGGDRDRGKRPDMARAAAEGADFLVLTSDNPRSEDPETILDELESGLRNRRVPRWRDVDRGRAVAAAIGEARAGDTVVVAGKGHERFQLFGDRRVASDDHVLCSNALAALGYTDRAHACSGNSAK